MECWSNEGFRFKILDLLIDASRIDGFHNLSPAFLNSQLSFGRPPFGRIPSCAFRNPKLLPSALCSTCPELVEGCSMLSSAYPTVASPPLPERAKLRWRHREPRQNDRRPLEQQTYPRKHPPSKYSRSTHPNMPAPGIFLHHNEIFLGRESGHSVLEESPDRG
jgi:hypothetical protein